jgi:cytochrome c peroxidase
MEEAVRDMALYQCDTKLSEGEINDIVAFLRTLTGEFQGRKLSNPYEYGVVINHDDVDHEKYHQKH